MKKKKKRWLLLLIIPVVLVAVRIMRGGAGEVSDLQITVASVSSIQEKADGSGILEGISKVEISAERAGLIETIEVEVGDTIETGQLLLVLESTDAAANLSSSVSQIESASIALNQSRRELDRTSELFQAELVSAEQMQMAQESERLRVQELSRANAAYTIAQNNLSKTSYVSPINGIVTALNVEEGEIAIEGTMNNAGTVLMTIEDMSAFQVIVTMVESEIVSVRKGMNAEVVLDALPETIFTGTVETVGLSATSGGGGETAAEFEVVVRLDSTHESMRSGMSASVEIVIAVSDSSVIVPIQSVVQRPDPSDPSIEVPSLLLLVDGRVESTPVETGISDIMEIAVTGIPEGSRIISGPVEALRSLEHGDTPERGAYGGGSGGGGPFGGGPPR